MIAMYLSSTDILHVQEQVQRHEWTEKDRIRKQKEFASSWSYQLKLGRGTIWLDAIEYRILRFLAARPYRAFTRKRIAQAVSTDSHPVTADSLGRHIKSLRDKLGFFADYIQSVPYIGYRFKE